MQRWLFLLAAMAASAYGAPAPAAEPDKSYPVLAFVGRLITIEEGVDPCAADTAKGEELTCISMDSIYAARYEVLEVLSGDYAAHEITFQVADHYGFPKFAEYRTALLFVGLHPDGAWLEKYQGIPVHRIAGGSWASCGDPISGYDEPPSERVQPLEFLDDLGIVGEYSREGLSSRFYDLADLEIGDGRIRCRQGIRVVELYDMVRTGVLAARGVTIPPLAESAAIEP